MATALVDLYGGDGFERFDRIILPEGYRPSDSEEFMCARHRAYFLRKLKAWKEAIIEESRQTMAQLQVDSLREPDLADRASSETDWSIELRTRDRPRKLISAASTKANTAIATSPANRFRWPGSKPGPSQP
jgi:DnaK suppressor protein